MEFIENKDLQGVYEIRLEPRRDDRGFFMRIYDEKLFAAHGLNCNWVQENHSRSIKKNTIRGLHFYLPPYSEAKMIRVIHGRIFDVVVDLRKNSHTFGKWVSYKLNAEDHKWVYIPSGFAHGFCSLVNNTEMIYRHEKAFAPQIDSGIFWNDHDVKISWPIKRPIISEKDKGLMSMNEFVELYGGL